MKTDASREATRASLAAAVAARPSRVPIKPMRIADWLAQYDGKSFIGTLTEDHFKVWLFNKGMSVVRRRGHGVVAVGTIEDGGIRVRLRPPVFNLLFALVFTAAVGSVFVLSFYGPSNTPTVHWLIAGFLIVPLAILVWSFVVEARMVERTLAGAVGDVSTTRG